MNRKLFIVGFLVGDEFVTNGISLKVNSDGNSLEPIFFSNPDPSRWVWGFEKEGEAMNYAKANNFYYPTYDFFFVVFIQVPRGARTYALKDGCIAIDRIGNPPAILFLLDYE